MKISEIKSEFESADLDSLSQVMDSFRNDERAGVQKLIAQFEKKKEAYEKELKRLEVMRQFEEEYKESPYICGIDEVGRGPLCGPVVASAVILPKDAKILYINDSKQLSQKKREALFPEIMQKAVAVGTGIVSPQEIDELNILQATYKAMRMAISSLPVKPTLLLNDAVTIPEVDIPQVKIIKGDAKSMSIAAASIIAKVTRDRMMVEYDKVFPQYGLAKNKGYGSKEHIEALRKYGPCPIHRKTFITHFV
ncbi:MAG TPA: ribonuclease HII [Lachnospiraceae bacterium]|nr:ribonuclease HII [Lachnospiraceae bacterium]